MYKNQSLMNNDCITDAWRLFMDRGVVSQDILYPHIARSWTRCYKQGKKDYDINPLVPTAVKNKQETNSRLIELAIPVMKDIDTMLKNITDYYVVTLLDNEGYVIDLLNRGSDSIQLGVQCDEMSSGTNAIGIALREGKITEVTGYEHLYPLAHDWHTTASVIRNYDNSMIGALGIINLTGRLPSSLQAVSLGSQLIQANLVQEQISNINSNIVMDNISDMTVLINEQGIILNASGKFLELIETSREDVIGHYLEDYLSESINYEKLFATRLEYLPNMVIDANNCHVNIKVHPFINGQRGYRDLSSPPLALLVFEQIGKSTRKTKKFSFTPTNISSSTAWDKLIGECSAFIKIKDLAQKAAHSVFYVLIEGESGTGKELIAQAIHKESHPDGPMVVVNCGSIPRELLHSELFGYEQGAFTGAKKEGSPGKFELADGGTLFLDEIGEMPLNLQVSLLRFLQDKVVTRLGGSVSKQVDVRIIAATNRNLYDEVQKGTFREDLYYRLNVIQIKTPPLRERIVDIPLLATHILDNICENYKFGKKELSKEAIDMLCSYHWPGNVRELQNVIQRAVVFAENDLITTNCLPYHLMETTSLDTPETTDDVRNYEKYIIIDILRKQKGNISKSAHELGISRATVYNKIKKYGINYINYKE